MRKLLACGTIKKYVVAGEQKAIVNVVMPDKDKASQIEARKYFNGMFKNFAKEVTK